VTTLPTVCIAIYRGAKSVNFQEFHLLSAQQWGFTHGESATEALLATTDNWHRLLDSGLTSALYSSTLVSIRHSPPPTPITEAQGS